MVLPSGRTPMPRSLIERDIVPLVARVLPERRVVVPFVQAPESERMLPNPLMITALVAVREFPPASAIVEYPLRTSEFIVREEPVKELNVA